MKACHCFVKHPVTPDERKEVSDAIAYARKVGDSLGTMLAIARLTGKCSASTKSGEHE